MEEQLHLNLARFSKGAYVILAEDKHIADRFFIIHEGSVLLSKEVHTAGEKDEILGPGDFFGVVSTMSGHSNIETAQATTDVVMVAVRQEQYSRFIQNNTPAAKKILLQFSKRMRHLNQTLAGLNLKKDAHTDVNRLFHVAEYYAKECLFKQAHYAYNRYIKLYPNGNLRQKAEENLKKIAPHIKKPRREFKPNEMTRTYHKDDMIFAESEPGEEIFIISSGSVKITKVSKNSELLLAILKAGDIFGEMALLESKPRDAGAVAFEECELMVVNRENFDHMIKTQPQLIAKLTTLLAERIWMSYRQLANTQINDSLGRMYDMLLIQLEKKHNNLDDRGQCRFDFGTKEIISMTGLSQADGYAALHKLLQIEIVVIKENKVVVTNVSEFCRQAAFYRKKLEIEKNRRGKQ